MFIIPGSKTLGPPGSRAWGFFVGGTMANRITFLVDGFNLYHSVVDLREDTVVDAIYYFSALA